MVSAESRAQPVLTHRYSFQIDARDSVGAADGTLQGNALVANGVLILDGTNSSVRLPDGLLTNYDSASLEVWFADAAINSSNALVYTFSGSQGSLVYQLVGRATCSSGGTSAGVTLPSPAVGGTNHLIWVQSATAQTAQLFVNGLLEAQNLNFTNTPSSLGSTTTNCIGGNATSNTVLNFKGKILEFRVYRGGLTPMQAAVLDAFGPAQAQLDPGALQAVRIVLPDSLGPGALFRAGVFADFANVTNVNVSTQPDLVLASDNTSVIAIQPDQRVRTVGLGTANLTALWQGFSNTLAVTVAVPRDLSLIHRYRFNELTNDWIVHDAVGRANGQISPSGCAFTGRGELTLSGPLHGYVTLPPDLVSCLSEVSFEAWVTWTTRTSWPWQRIFDFGSGPYNYLFLTTEANTFLTNGDVARFTISTNSISYERPRLNWTNILPLNVTSYVAVTYSPARGLAKFYVNGRLVDSGVATIPLSAIVDTNNWLGRSQYNGDSYFGGRYEEFRIYRGVLQDADVATNYAAGSSFVGVDSVLHGYLATNSFTVTWGTSAATWRLESTAQLGPSALWSPISMKPTIQNGRYSVTLPLADSGYFRLRAP